MSDLNDLHQMLGKMDSKIDSLLEARQDQERRLRRIEAFVSWLTGAGAIVTAVFGWLLTKVTS